MSGRGSPLGFSCLNGRGFVGPALLSLRSSGTLFGGLLLYLLAVASLQGKAPFSVGTFFTLSHVVISPA